MYVRGSVAVQSFEFSRYPWFSYLVSFFIFFFFHQTEKDTRNKVFARRTVSFSRRREIPTYTDPLSVDRFFMRVFIGSIAFRVRIESGKKQPRERSGKAWNQPDGEIRASP